MSNRHPASGTTLTHTGNNLFVAGILLLLSAYIFFKGITLSGGLAFSDWLAMVTAIQQDCSLKISGAWTPPVQCLNTFLGNFVFPNPIIYLFVTMGLKIAMLYALYQIFANLVPNQYDRTHKSALALTILVFIVIGGGGRFLIGGTELILNSSIYSGMWAHLLVLTALAFFVKGRLATSGTVIALAVFIHPANTFNVFMILLIVGLAQFWSQSSVFKRSQIFLFALFGATALTLQYLAAFGMPSLDFLNHLSSTFSEFWISGNNEVKALEVMYSNSEWYAYILSQDPDDLSLIWLLSSKIGVFYLSFFLVGLFLAGQVENSYRPTVLLGRLPIVLILASALYFLCCALIEYFQFPNFVFAKLIVVQPRRAFFLPVLFLSYYFVRYFLEFLLQTDKPNLRHWTILLIVYSWFFTGLLLTTYGNHISTRFVTILYLTGLFLIWLFYWSWGNKKDTFFYKLIANPKFLLQAAVVAIVFKTLPFVNAQTFTNIGTMYLERESRSFADYLALKAKLVGDESFQHYQGLVHWMRSSTPPGARFVSAGFSEDKITQLPYLTERKTLSLNVYRYRGGLQFLKEEFETRIGYFEALLGIPWQEMGATGGQLNGLQELVESMDEEHFRNMIYGSDARRFDYFITRYSLDLEFPIVYRGGNIVAYQITRQE